jgi:hypothetical protein
MKRRKMTVGGRENNNATKGWQKMDIHLGNKKFYLLSFSPLLKSHYLLQPNQWSSEQSSLGSWGQQ